MLPIFVPVHRLTVYRFVSEDEVSGCVIDEVIERRAITFVSIYMVGDRRVR